MKEAKYIIILEGFAIQTDRKMQNNKQKVKD